MIYVGVLALSGIEEIDDILEKLPENITERIKRVKFPGERALKTGAYLLLYTMYERFFGKGKMPEIIYTPQGKPFFDGRSDVNKCCHFNISHDKNTAAVAVSFDEEVGLDVQSTNQDQNLMERIERRFGDAASQIDVDGEIPVSFLFYEVRDGEVSQMQTADAEVSAVSEKEAESNPVIRWTALESVLKLDGGGFASINKVEDIAERSRVKSYILKANGCEYALSVATKK